jgi:hypothetical protein
MITSTISDDDFALRWTTWLSQPAGINDAKAAQVVEDLLNEFRHSATPKTLIGIILGDAYREVSRTVVPAAQLEVYIAELRATGHVVRVEQGNAVVALRRLPNLRELTRAGRVARGPLVFALECECRNADGRIPRSASVSVLDQLNQWRRLFMACLMDGRPPPKPVVKVEEGPASECPASGAPSQPAEIAQGESDPPLRQEGQAAESPEQPKTQDAEPYSVRRARRLAKHGGGREPRPSRANVGHAELKQRFGQ